MKGGLLFQKLLTYTRFYLLACTIYGDKKTKDQDARVHHGFCIVWKLAAIVNCFEYYFYSSLPAQRPFSRKTTFRFEFNGTESVRLWSVNT